MISVITTGIGSFLASIGFAILFNERGKSVYFAGLCGCIGGVVYRIVVLMTRSEIISNLAAAVCFSVVAEIMARVLKETVTSFTAPALIPLVPGGTVYQMMLQLTQNNIISGIQLGLEAIAIAGALALGMMVVSTLSRLYYAIQRMIRKNKKKLQQKRKGKKDAGNK